VQRRQAAYRELRTRRSSARGGWLSSFFRDLSGESAQAHRRRLVVAFSVALALIEIVAMAIPLHTYTLQTESVARITIAKLTRIEHRVKPTPRPTPKPIVHVKAVAETHVQPKVVNPAAPSQQHHIRRIASARPLTHTRFHSRVATTHVPTGGHGTGTSTTANAETGGIGPGGNGTGESGTGTGTGGAPAAQVPCGYVDFSPNGKPTTDPKTGRVWEYVAIVVHFPDGSEQSVDLDYPFYYQSEAQDPFIHENIPATFQFPPPNQAPNEPPLVQYVIQHTTADGYTLLHECRG